MTDEDFEAMLELTDDMSFADAVRFVRREWGCGLRQAAELIEMRRNKIALSNATNAIKEPTP